MKNLMIIVALTVMTVAKQAQGFKMVVMAAPTAFDLKSTPSSDAYPKTTLSGSEEGVSYQLYCTEQIDSKEVKVAVGDPVKGTGAPLTFKVDKAGEYTVVGNSDKMNGCVTDMNGVLAIIKKGFDPGTITGKEKSTASVTGEKFNPGGMTIFSKLSGGPDAPEEYEPPTKTSDYIIVVFFLAVFGLVMYGIRNRLSKKYTLGNHQEIKPPYTRKVYLPKK